MTTTRKVWIAVGVVLAMLLVWLFLLMPTHSEAATRPPRPTPTPTTSPAPEPIPGYTVDELVELNTAASFVEDDNDDQGKAKTAAALAAAGCKNKTHGISVYNSIGNYLYRFSESVNWCYGSQGKIQSQNWSQAPDIGNQIWNTYRYNGISGTPARSGGVGNTWTYRRVTGEFEACITGGICIFDYPWVAITARGDGTSSVGAGLG